MPELLPAFPLSTVLFPHALLPLQVFEPRYRTMTKECLDHDRRFGVVLISRGSEVGGGEERVRTGTVAHIEEVVELADGRFMLLVRGGERFWVDEWLTDDPYPRGMVDILPEEPADFEIAGLLSSAASSVRRARALLSELREAPPPLTDEPADVVAKSWWLCEEAPITTFDRQRLLECHALARRLALITETVDSVADDITRLLASE